MNDIDFIDGLLSKHKVRTVLASADLKTLERIQANLTGILDVLIEEQKKKIQLQLEQEASIKSMLAELTAKGISKESILSVIGVPVPVEEKPKAKYVKDGVEWSGRGKPPKVFTGLSKEELSAYQV